MKKEFYEAIKERRSVYAISKESTISDDRIVEVVNEAVKYNPSAFNSQSGRAVVLLGENHDKLWDLTMEALRKIVPADQFAPTEEKINSFKNGYGTVLFFEDINTIEALQQQFALYSDNFPVWSQHSSGMLQYIVWTSLAIEGLGASLQHYNPLIENKIKEVWQIPDNWKLVAQMPFGKPVAPAGVKAFLPLEDRVKIFK